MSENGVRESSRRRAGKRFEPTHELPLHEVAARVSLALRGAKRGLILIREMPGPIGIPDLVALVGNPGPLERRLSLEVPPLLNEIDAAIAAVAHAGAPRTTQALARTLGWPEDTLRRRIPGLLKSGALLRSGRDSFVRPPELAAVGRLVAIEAKVNDWRGALAQGRTYGVWADNYVLVMGRLSSSARSELTAHVAQDAAGLVIDGQWVERLGRRVSSPTKRLWASEHLVAALVGQDHHPSATP